MNTAREDDLIAAELADPARQLNAIMHLVEDASVVVSDETLDALARCLGAGRKAIERRAADAFVAIAARDKRAAAVLLRVIEGAEPRARWTAAYALARCGGGPLAERAIDALFEALANDDGDVRWAAANLIVALGRENRAAIVARLLALAGGENPVAQRMALYGLRDLNADGDAMREAIERASLADSTHLRLAALAALGCLKDPAAAARIALERLEQDQDAGVRRAAAAALGAVASGSPRARAALTLAASSGDESLARAARAALKRTEQS
jgi:HEAT repeat protein